MRDEEAVEEDIEEEEEEEEAEDDFGMFNAIFFSSK